MKHKGQVYKFVGVKGVIRPDKFGQVRVDVLFDRHKENLVIGDKIEYEQVEKNRRKYAENIKKIG
jgi:hypothetical protein|tara:strand:+ start:381 stop:575 length:195 start_codon:yes stop_codon:yes gene_type:complete